jgi:N-carbamoylputrescine amidase
MTALRVALLQVASHGLDQEANLAAGLAACREARELGADIALFPEMWNVGYSTAEMKADGRAWNDFAVERDGPFVARFRELARELDMAIAITYLQRWDTLPRNAVSIIDRRGEVLMTYAKVHTCDFDLEAALTPGEEFPVCELDTPAGTVSAGAMICYDREFPESARVLMLQGAELILTPNACTLDHVRLEQFRVRAYENMVAVAMANYPAPHKNGHSVAFDPIVCLDDESSRDNLVLLAGEQPGVYIAPFDLDAIRDYRGRETWGNAFRKPRAYTPLVSPDVRDPFIRPEARR